MVLNDLTRERRPVRTWQESYGTLLHKIRMRYDYRLFVAFPLSYKFASPLDQKPHNLTLTLRWHTRLELQGPETIPYRNGARVENLQCAHPSHLFCHFGQEHFAKCNKKLGRLKPSRNMKGHSEFRINYLIVCSRCIHVDKFVYTIEM